MPGCTCGLKAETQPLVMTSTTGGCLLRSVWQRSRVRVSFKLGSLQRLAKRPLVMLLLMTSVSYARKTKHLKVPARVTTDIFGTQPLDVMLTRVPIPQQLQQLHRRQPQSLPQQRL